MPTPLFAADDWGFSPAINAGILTLARRGVLHSVSCASNAPYLETRFEDLRAYLRAGVRLNLHFNLTYGRALAATHPRLVTRSGEFRSHGWLLRRNLLGGLPAAEIRAEFRAQYARLAALGENIHAIDGHHHVHLLPAVARALRAEPEARRLRALWDLKHPPSFLQSLVYRCVYRPRATVVETCAYLQPRDLESARHFRRKLARRRGRPLLVHPALSNDFARAGMRDSLTEYRVYELDCILRYLEENHG